EEAKIAIRNVRRDGNKQIDTLEKDKLISEDQRDQAKETVQEYTKKYEEMATDAAKKREAEVMED
ncbi:MAG: ribosome recycling factor, partial [Thermoguttaceae bacterium]|nr:ribosome recycling factor [Thermoguttaceae bacterium]